MKNNNREGAEGEKGMKYGISPCFLAFAVKYTRFLMFIMKNSNRKGAEGEKGMKYGIVSLDSPSFLSPSFFAFFAFAV
jgi:hypothetical protein